MNAPSPRVPNPNVGPPSLPSMNNMPGDDEIYQNSPLQFTADRMGKLVRIAERDPKRQVMVPMDTMNKLYMAYLGVLEVYQELTAAGVVINGERHNCSAALQKALIPLIDLNRKVKAEAEVLEMVALMEKEESDKNKGSGAPLPLRSR